MSATIIDELMISLGIDGSAAKKGMSEVTNSIQGGVSKITGMLGGLTAAFAGVFAVGSAFNDYLNSADAMAKFSRSIGANIEDVHAWSEAVIRSGGSAEGFQGSVKGLTTQLSKMATLGKSKAGNVLAAVGIDPGEVGRQRDAFDVLMDISDKMQEMSAAEATGFGQSLGLDVGTINLLREGRDGVKDLIRHQKELGVYDEATAKAAEDFNDAMADIQRFQKLEGGLSGVPSGFPSIDKITLGWQASDLIILAARPSVGKTAFVLNLARNAAVDFNMPVAIFSLEMPSIQLAKRMMVSETRLSADKIKGGTKLEPHEWVQLEEQLKRLAKAPLYIDDTPSLPVMEFRSKVKKLVKQKGVRLVVVDYLQLMQGPAELRGMREQEVAAISRTLKATAKELNVPIIALSQLSRQSENRQGSNRRPQLSDLRESGSIEQDADMVIFIHRYDYQGLSDNPDDIGRTQIIIAKHRNGAIADVDMKFRADEVRFVDEQESLAHHAAALNESIPEGYNIIGASDFGTPMDDFATNVEFQ